ncbi:MAG: ATPase, T2SS/T4P/T4SS family [Actinomycetaceae bacterium]|nr:ATPase, T2SS/T4P/T4SS family [Actinomycetaceae bacterium]
MTVALESQVRERILKNDIDPRDRHQVVDLIQDSIAQWQTLSDAGHVPPIEDPHRAAQDLLAAFTGYGQLQPLLEDPDIEEIWINSASRIFISRAGRTELTTVVMTQEEVETLVERMLRSSGRRLDYSSPFVDAALPTGERLHVVIPPVTSGAWAVNIRKHIVRTRKLADLVHLGELTPPTAQFLRASVKAGLNIVVSGATQAGKTTLVRALAGSIPSTQRVITCEEVFELALNHRDVVAMQTRQSSIEGFGEITLRRLVVEALRMRPERIIIGEVRGAEALDMLIGLNAGVPGMSTIHANSAREALNKLCTLPLLAGENVTDSFVVPTVAQAIDLVVHVERDIQSHRQVVEILGVTGRVEGSQIEATELFAMRNGRLRRSTGTLESHARFAKVGEDLGQLLKHEEAL